MNFRETSLRCSGSCEPREPKALTPRAQRPAPILLLAAAETNLNALRDIKPPVEISSFWPWIWMALGALVLAIAVAGLISYFNQRRRQVPAEPVIPPHVRARQKLADALALISQPKPFCTLVSDTIRYYLEERFNFRAPERTTEEFLHELKKTDLLLPDQKESLAEFLNRCDLVKFARYEPREAELRDLHESAARLVDETEPPPQTESSNPKPATTRP